MTDKLKILIEKCSNSVSITINEHRDSYQTVEEYFNSNPIYEEYLEDIDADIYLKMKELNTIVDIHFYPTSPIGFFQIYHYDLETALDIALDTFKN